MRAVELEAGEQFRGVGLPEIAAAEPMAESALAAYVAAGRAFVDESAEGAVVGYAVVDLVDGGAHLEQVSALPAEQRRCRGRRLVAAVEAFAAGTGLEQVTLTTFRDVSWNHPLTNASGSSCCNKTSSRRASPSAVWTRRPTASTRPGASSCAGRSRAGAATAVADETAACDEVVVAGRPASPSWRAPVDHKQAARRRRHGSAVGVDDDDLGEADAAAVLGHGPDGSQLS